MWLGQQMKILKVKHKGKERWRKTGFKHKEESDITYVQSGHYQNILLNLLQKQSDQFEMVQKRVIKMN